MAKSSIYLVQELPQLLNPFVGNFVYTMYNFKFMVVSRLIFLCFILLIVQSSCLDFGWNFHFFLYFFLRYASYLRGLFSHIRTCYDLSFFFYCFICLCSHLEVTGVHFVAWQGFHHCLSKFDYFM